MQVTHPNILAVIIMSLVYMGLGGLWYSKGLFGKITGSCCETEKTESTTPTKCYIGCLIIAFITAYILGYFINMAGAVTTGEGIKVALLAWLGFIATTMYFGVLWGKKPLSVYLVDAGFMFVMFVIWGAVFTNWH
jgi:hypothetical protein